MEYLRQTVDSEKLKGIFNLPLALRHKKVEVIILPAEKDSLSANKTGSAFGCLKEYANPALVAHEKGAWQRAVEKSHANR